MKDRLLEILFRRGLGQGGLCPLPEPTEDMLIHEPEHMRIEAQPPDFDCDRKLNNEEWREFVERTKQLFETGLLVNDSGVRITSEEFEKLIDTLDN